MRSQNHAQTISLQELVHSVSPKLHDVVLSLRISGYVWLNPQLFLTFTGIAPKQVHHKLLILSGDFTQVNLTWSLNFFNFLNLHGSGPDSPMHTEHLVLSGLVNDDSSQRHVLKHLIDLVKNTPRSIDVFPQSPCTLFPETQVLVDILVFMVPSENEDLLGILQLQSHQ